MQHGSRSWRARIGLWCPCVKWEKRNKNAETKQKEQVNTRCIRNKSGLGVGDHLTKIKRTGSNWLDQIKTNDSKQKNKATRGKVNRGFPCGCLTVTGSPYSNEKECRNERQLMEHVEKEYIHGGKCSDHARGNQKQAGIIPAGIIVRGLSHAHGSEGHHR